MTTKSDFQPVRPQRTDERGAGLGEPPSADEMLAYSRGEMTPEDEERFQERLALHPEYARILAGPFPAEGAEPGDADYLSEDEFATHWAAMQTRMKSADLKPADSKPADPPVMGRLLQFRRFSMAAAATVITLLGGLLAQSEWHAYQVARNLAQPRLAPEGQVLLPDGQLLQPDGQRGGESGVTPIATKSDSYLLVAPLINATEFTTYRLEMVNVGTTSPQTLWKSAPAVRRNDDSFAVIVPRAFLDSGRYQLILYGVSGSQEERVASYSFRVPRAATSAD